jgi:hypothetical protein
VEIIHQEAIDLEEVVRLCRTGIKRDQPKERDKSRWHVSNLLNAGREIVRGNVVYPEYNGAVKGIMSFGSLWELMVDCFLSDYAAKQSGFYSPDVECVRDDIIASLDGVVFLPDFGMMVAETKLRFTQGRDIPFSHIQQISAYCHLMSTDLVCYVSGHVSSTPPTVTAALRVLRLEKQRIAETWQGICSTKKYLESQGCVPTGS